MGIIWANVIYIWHRDIPQAQLAGGHCSNSPTSHYLTRPRKRILSIWTGEDPLVCGVCVEREREGERGLYFSL
jgi:hypothetical protein